MKLLRRDAATALQKANEDLTAVEAEIVRLQQEHSAKLLDVEVPELDAINRRIGDLDRQANYYRERIARFEAQLEVEKEEQRQRDYVAACAALDGPLENLNRVAKRLEKNDAERAALVTEFKGEVRSVLKSWPETVEWPDRVYLPGHISTAPLGERYRDALGPDLRNKFSHQAPLVGEWVDRHSRPHLDGFGSEIAKQNADLSEALRTAHDELAPVETEEEAA